MLKLMLCSLVLAAFAPLSAARADLIEAQSLWGDDLRHFLERSNCDTMDPNSICGGDPTAPPSVCVYSDPSACSGQAFGREKWAQYAGNSSISSFADSDGSNGDRPEYNSVVALVNDDAKVLCSGTLISSNLVLTAAHCIGAGAKYVFVGSRITKTSSGEAAHDGWLFDVTEEETFEEGSGDDTCRRSHLRFTTSDYLKDDGEPDIGLVRFENNKPFSSSFIETILSEEDLARVLMRREYKNFLGVSIAGFGASETRDSGGQKRYAYIGNVSYCSDYDDHACRVGSYEFVDRGNADTCYGDSGGLAFGYGVQDIGGYLFGITSRSAETGGNTYCGEGGVYTSIFPAGLEDAFRDGIRPEDLVSVLDCRMPWLWILERLRG